jgi:hypothetical protein
MVPPPPAHETSPRVAAEIRRLNALEAVSSPFFASRDTGVASGERKNTPTRKGLVFDSEPGGTTRTTRSAPREASEVNIPGSTPTIAPGGQGQFVARGNDTRVTGALKNLTPIIMYGTVSDAIATEEPQSPSRHDGFPGTTPVLNGTDRPARPAPNDAPVVVVDRVRALETAHASRTTFASLDTKLESIESNLQRARNLSAEKKRRVRLVETENRELRKRLDDALAAVAGKDAASRAYDLDHAKERVAAALYVDVERLSMELRESKREVSEAQRRLEGFAKASSDASARVKTNVSAVSALNDELRTSKDENARLLAEHDARLREISEMRLELARVSVSEAVPSAILAEAATQATESIRDAVEAERVDDSSRASLARRAGAETGGGVDRTTSVTKLVASLTFALATVFTLTFGGLLFVAMMLSRGRTASGDGIATTSRSAACMRESLDEILSGTLGTPFRGSGWCADSTRLADPPAT